MAAKVPVKGTQFEESADDGATFRHMCVKNFPLPTASPEYEDVTDSCSGGVREFVQTLIDNGEVTLNMFYSGDEYAQQLQNAGNLMTYRVTFPLEDGETTSATATYKAYPTPSIPDKDVSQVWEIEVALKVSGAVDFQEGS